MLVDQDEPIGCQKYFVDCVPYLDMVMTLTISILTMDQEFWTDEENI